MIKETLKKLPLYRLNKMKSISRLNLDLTLIKILKHMSSKKVLDIGASKSPYKKYIKHEKYLTVDIDAKSNPDIVGSIYDFKWKDNDFDMILATEILEHLNEPQRAVNRLYKLLKNGGKCVLTTRFIHPYHPCPQDYYRYTEDSLKEIFREFNKIKIIYQGNRFTTIWFMLSESRFTSFLRILNPILAKINVKNTRFPMGFIVVAVK